MMISQIMEISAFTLYDTKGLFEKDDLNCLKFFERSWTVQNVPGRADVWRCWYLYTNVKEKPPIPSYQKFLITRVNALFFKDGKPLRLYETDLYSLTEIEFWINAKPYWQSPAWRCASPFALFDTPKVEISRMKDKYGIEWDQVGGSVTGKDVDGLLIEKAEMFGVNAHVHCAVSQIEGVTLAIHLDGPLARPVI